MIVKCPFCHYKEAVPEEYAGMIGECSNCGKEFKITKPMSFQQQMPYQREKSEEAYPILCFVLGFFFSLIGILVAYIIDKKNVVKAVIGFVIGFILLFFCSMGLYYGRATGMKVAGAAAAISEEDGGKTKSALEDINLEDINEDTIKKLGE